jgi:serine protease Do
VEGKHDLHPAKIGNSSAVQVGDWAMAIGSPFGFQATVTAGIISATERDIDPTMQFQHFLQTDAAINPGNSGGPLLNMRGEVIGINTAIASQSGGYQGIGFALPMNTAAMVYNAIIKDGKVTRGSIGIKFTPSDTERARSLLKASGINDGVFVQSVEPGGPSDKAGLKDGDIIIAINGKTVKDGSELVNTVTATPVGNTVAVTVVRDGKHENYKVVVGDLSQIFPDSFGGAPESAKTNPQGTTVSFGMSILELTAQQRTNLGLKESGGLQVVEVEPDSFAEDVGLLQGDILMSINSKPISTTEDVKKIQATLKPGQAVAFRVLRKAGRGEWQTAYVAGTLPQK